MILLANPRQDLSMTVVPRQRIFTNALRAAILRYRIKQRGVSLQTICDFTGIHENTLTRFINNDAAGLSSHSIDRLFCFKPLIQYLDVEALKAGAVDPPEELRDLRGIVLRQAMAAAKQGHE